jgi:hypothetical protein
MPEEQGNPYLPSGPQPPLTFSEFMGIDTETTRPGVDDKQMWWCSGWMPLKAKNLRVLPDVGAAIYTSGIAIRYFDFGNIGSAPYSVIVRADGSIVMVNTNTNVAQTIAPAGTISNPSRVNSGVSQWGSQYIIIVAQQVNGYFLWDGALFYQPGTLAPLVTITANGSNYTAPTVTATGGSGSGATFSSTVVNGLITAITITNPGKGYLATDSVTLTITDSTGTGATATAQLMPYAVSGTAVETYAGRVWIVNGNELIFSAPGSYQNFATSAGGGNVSSSDSFLRVSYIQPKQTNGFLYLIADSSINYISGVQTSGSPPTTTFTNQNADPEVGTPYASTVEVFGRDIVFANAFGAHISYGAAVNKISDALNGVYNTVPNFGGLVPSSAKAIIFGRKVWILLLAVINPVTNLQVNELFMWDGKRWWSSEQSVNILFIGAQEINSILTAYGTDGSSLYPLFTTPSNNFTKTVQSKLWDEPGSYMLLKGTTRLWGNVQYNILDGEPVEVGIDNEAGQGPLSYDLNAPVMVWTTANGTVMSWTTASSVPMIWTYSGYGILEPTAIGQVGVLMGFTIATIAKDVSLIAMLMDAKIEGYRG